jgi:RNA polymerase sigma factor (sigma-70 family)
MSPENGSVVADLEVVYREQRLPLVRLGYLLSGSHDAAEDAVQTAFASAQAHWARVEDPVAYLRRAVVNQVKGEQRRVLRRAARVVPRDPEVDLPPEVDETWTALRRLTPHQRTVVVLHYYADLPLVEIADLVGRPAATVRSDHRRALDSLRKALS